MTSALTAVCRRAVTHHLARTAVRPFSNGVPDMDPELLAQMKAMGPVDKSEGTQVRPTCHPIFVYLLTSCSATKLTGLWLVRMEDHGEFPACRYCARAKGK